MVLICKTILFTIFLYLVLSLGFSSNATVKCMHCYHRRTWYSVGEEFLIYKSLELLGVHAMNCRYFLDGTSFITYIHWLPWWLVWGVIKMQLMLASQKRLAYYKALLKYILMIHYINSPVLLTSSVFEVDSFFCTYFY